MTHLINLVLAGTDVILPSSLTTAFDNACLCWMSRLISLALAGTDVILPAFLTAAGTPEAFTAAGLKTHAGQELRADVVIYATGFVRQYDYLPAKELKALGQTPEGIPLYRDALPLNVPVRL